jgi:hypothetical protein
MVAAAFGSKACNLAPFRAVGLLAALGRLGRLRGSESCSQQVARGFLRVGVSSGQVLSADILM